MSYARGMPSKSGKNRLRIRRDTCATSWACFRLVGVLLRCRSQMRSSESRSSESAKPSQNHCKSRLPPTLRHRLWPSTLSENVFPSLQKGIATIYDIRNVCARACRVEKRAGRGAVRPQRHDSEVLPKRGKAVKSRLPGRAHARAAYRRRAATKPAHTAVRETSCTGARSGAPAGRGIFSRPAAHQSTAPSEA